MLVLAFFSYAGRNKPTLVSACPRTRVIYGERATDQCWTYSTKRVRDTYRAYTNPIRTVVFAADRRTQKGHFPSLLRLVENSTVGAHVTKTIFRFGCNRFRTVKT